MNDAVLINAARPIIKLLAGLSVADAHRVLSKTNSMLDSNSIVQPLRAMDPDVVSLVREIITEAPRPSCAGQGS